MVQVGRHELVNRPSVRPTTLDLMTLHLTALLTQIIGS